MKECHTSYGWRIKEVGYALGENYLFDPQSVGIFDFGAGIRCGLKLEEGPQPSEEPFFFGYFGFSLAVVSGLGQPLLGG